MLRSLYRLLLRLHPPAFRERYADEMLWIFDETADGLETVRLLGDAAASLVRQRLLRPDRTDSNSRRLGPAGAAPMFLSAASSLPPARILSSGALCSLLLFGAVGSVVAGGGRQAFTAVPHAEAVRATTLSFLALAAPPQQPDTAAEEPGSISGRVVDGMTGQPVAGAKVQATGRGVNTSTVTDTQGRYRLDDVPVSVRGIMISPPGAATRASGSRRVALDSGDNLKGINFRLYPPESVSGIVTDSNGEPLEGIEVAFLRREYDMGGIRHVRTAVTRTNDLGEYRLERSYFAGSASIPALIWARRPQLPLPAISDAPASPAMRRQAVESTYYPNGVRPEEGAVIRLARGEQRQDVNIQLRTSQSYCADVQATLPGPLEQANYVISTVEPPLAAGRSSALYSRVTPAHVGTDGRLRICDLARGDYRLVVYGGGDEPPPTAMGVTLFSITDEDVQNLQVSVQPRTPLHGKTTWAAGPPASPFDETVYIDLARLHHGFGGGIHARPKIPEDFRFEWTVSIGGDVDDPLMDEYRVDVRLLPQGVYVKDVTHGGESVWNKPFHLGSKPAGVGLEVILAHDGGKLHARVASGKGEPVGDATVVLIPKTAATHIELADTRLTGLTDNKGQAALGNIPPGEYWALAIDDNFMDYAVETIATLFNARTKGEEVNIGPNATVEIDLEVRSLER